MNEMDLLGGGRREGKGRPAATAKGRSEMEGREGGIRNLGSDGSGSRKQVRPDLVGARNSGKYLASKLIHMRYSRRGQGGGWSFTSAVKRGLEGQDWFSLVLGPACDRGVLYFDKRPLSLKSLFI
jgi:hypothetical protein